ncbi:hypothetical protein A9Z42_0009850 [Trichoderma parareesei]|uniref:Uncharacterized protein n=1 Tax=Trichoderma parareesei TaxID=858221 RepID=A0A2H2Z5K1_TRIPA|nr:hypothetical protein A9Z42_0009850 [Trichoderma parareesei]
MADQANQKKGDKGKQPATMPPVEMDVTETNVTEADVTEADAENLSVDHQGQQNPDQETAAGEPTEEAASSSEGATTAQEASAGQQAQLLKPWEQRALRNGRTPLPDSRPPIAGESSASGSQAQPTRRAPRPRWRIADIRHVIELARGGMAYADIRKYHRRNLDGHGDDHEVEIEEGDEADEDDEDEDETEAEDDEDDEDENADEEVALN